MRFSAGVNAVSFIVSIRDTGLVEQDEEFYIDLEIPTASTNLGVIKDREGNATVRIIDNDCECCSIALCTTINTTMIMNILEYLSVQN